MAAIGSTLGKPGSMLCLLLSPDTRQKLGPSPGVLWRPVQEDSGHTIPFRLYPLQQVEKSWSHLTVGCFL